MTQGRFVPHFPRMLDDLAIRRATGSDLEQIVSFWRDLQRVHVERGDGFVACSQDFEAVFRAHLVESLCRPDDSVVLVGELVGMPVGFATAKRMKMREMIPPDVGYLGSVYVRPESRRAGVGAALVKRCLQWGAAISLSRWVADVYCWNEPSLALLARFGLVSRSCRLVGDVSVSEAD